MAKSTHEHPKKVAILGYQGADLVDVTGPYEVFATASALASEAGIEQPYLIELLSVEGDAIVTDAGMTLLADRQIAEFDGGDTILIAGGVGKFGASSDARTLQFLQTCQPTVRRIGSVCTGAFLLAAAGILNGRRAATHWRWCDRFQELYPDVELDRDAIFVEDDGVFSTAGVTAGIDLALSMVEADCGRELAMAVAREMVVFVKRPGGQTQFSAQISSQMAERQPIRKVQNWISANPSEDVTVDELADLAGMSVRNFARVFKSETGETPRGFVEKIRLEHARLLLEEAKLTVDQVAVASGFASAEVLRRNFNKKFGVSPASYSKRFSR